MGYSERTENQIRRATEKAKKKKLEEYDLYNASEDEAVVGDYSPTPTYDDLVESSRNPDPYKGPSSILSVEEADAIRNRIGGKAVDKADAEWQASFDEKQERHGAGEQFPDTFDPRRKMPRSDSEMEELKWGNLKSQGKLREHNERFGGVPEHLLAEEAETQGTSGVEGEQGEPGAAMGAFKDKAEASDGFSNEEPQQTPEEERLASLGEAAYDESGGFPENDDLGPAETPEDEAALQKKWKEEGVADQQTHEEGRSGALAKAEEARSGAPLMEGGIAATQIAKDAAHVKELKRHEDRIRQLGSGKSRGEIAAANNPVWQQALAEKEAKAAKVEADRERGSVRYISDEAAERDSRAAKQKIAKYKAQHASGSVVTQGVVEPLETKNGWLGSIYYDSRKYKVIDIRDEAGDIVDREVVLRGGAAIAPQRPPKGGTIAPPKGEDKQYDPQDPPKGGGKTKEPVNPAWKGVLPILIEKFPAIKGILPWLIDEMAGEGASEASIIPTLIEKFPGINATPGLIEGLKDALFPSSNPVNGTPTLSPPVDEKVQGSQALGEASYTEPEGAQGPTGDDAPMYPTASDGSSLDDEGVVVIGRGEESSGPAGGDSGGAGGGEPMRDGHHEWGANEPLETAEQKQARGMVWVIPSKGGFKPGDQRFAGEGPGRWMREDQALAAETTNIERPIEEARRQAVLDKKNRTPQEVAEDNIREKRDHEEKLKRIEFDKDDDDDDIVEKEMEIKHLRELLAQPNLSIEQRNIYQQQLNALLAGGEVGAGGAGGAGGGDDGERPAGEHSLNLFAADEPLHTAITGLPWAATTGTNDHGDTGVMLQKIKEMLDGGRITESNKTAAFAYINSLIQDFMRTSIEQHKGGTDPAENSNWWWSNNIQGVTENDLYLFFEAIKAGQWPPGYPK